MMIMARWWKSDIVRQLWDSGPTVRSHHFEPDFLNASIFCRKELFSISFLELYRPCKICFLHTCIGCHKAHYWVKGPLYIYRTEGYEDFIEEPLLFDSDSFKIDFECEKESESVMTLTSPQPPWHWAFWTIPNLSENCNVEISHEETEKITDC